MSVNEPRPAFQLLNIHGEGNLEIVVPDSEINGTDILEIVGGVDALDDGGYYVSFITHKRDGPTRVVESWDEMLEFIERYVVNDEVPTT